MTPHDLICPSCGTKNPPGSTVCTFCATPLSSTPSKSPYLAETRMEINRPDAQLVPGDLIDNRYKILGVLGQGGMGIVYHIRDLKLQETEQALKVISPYLANDPSAMERFSREVLAAQSLTHENIVKVFHLDESGGVHFFIMEYLAGRSLRAVMEERFQNQDQGRVFSAKESWMILDPVLSALAHAHQKGVIHRDLKPENIMVDGDFPKIQIKILDFGLAKVMSPSRFTSSAMTLGTAYYMSPEQLSGRGIVDARSDLFSVGVILYELLTGKIPSGRFKLPGELVPEISEKLDEVVDTVLSAEPGDRYGTADTFRKNLADAVDYAVENSKQAAKADQLNKDAEKRREAQATAKRQAEFDQLCGKAQTYLDQAKFPLADEVIRKAMQLMPQDARVHMLRQRLSEMKPAFENAVAAIENSLSQGRLEEAKKAADQAQSICPDAALMVQWLSKIRIAEESAIHAETPSSSAQVNNTPGMKFVYIAPGTFMMGSPSDEPGRNSTERQHRVRLTQGYYLQTTEVTQGQWQAVMGNNPSHFKNCGDDCPVEQVSWNDVQEFIRKLNAREGAGKYRLPTEAEWEYACRAGTETPFAFGRCLSTDQANYNGNYPLSGCGKGTYREKTLPVGSFAPNAWGLYDMHGNVFEWCADWYGDYPSGSVTDPAGPSSSGIRVCRGGCWNCHAHNCRSATRNFVTPGNWLDFLGFRLLRTR